MFRNGRSGCAELGGKSDSDSGTFMAMLAAM
jgi:hypothetical protein